MSNRRIRVSVIFTCMLAALAVFQSRPAVAAVEGSFQRTLQVNGPVNLDLTTGSGSVQVRTGTASEVRITGHIKINERFASDADERLKRIESNPPIQQSGNDIHIGRPDNPDLRHNISISYELVVPAATRLRSTTGSGNQNVGGVQGPIEIQAGSGELKISDIGDTVRAETGSGGIEIDRVKGNVTARAGSGSIRATAISGSFEGRSGSGGIVLEQTAAGSVRAETGSGELELRGVQGSLKATAGSGGITAEGNPTSAWSLRTGSGSVHLQLASNTGVDLDAHTSSGSISFSQPVTLQGAIGRRELRGKLHGGGVPVYVETGSGSIEIR